MIYRCRLCNAYIHLDQNLLWVDTYNNGVCKGVNPGELSYHRASIKPEYTPAPQYKAPLPPVDIKINFTGEKLMHNDGTGDRYNLFLVSAFNPKTGEVVLEAKQVTATTQKSAENKAVGLLSQNLPEGKTLDEVLDEVEVRVRPF